jgi:hypothetical protein
MSATKILEGGLRRAVYQVEDFTRVAIHASDRDKFVYGVY